MRKSMLRRRRHSRVKALLDFLVVHHDAKREEKGDNTGVYEEGRGIRERGG